MVKEGDSIPDVTLFEGNPGDKVNLADVLKSGKGIILGVPAAFSEFDSLCSSLLLLWLGLRRIGGARKGCDLGVFGSGWWNGRLYGSA